MKPYKFNYTIQSTIPPNSRVTEIWDKLVANQKITQIEKEIAFASLQSSSTYGNGLKVAYLGWHFDFSPFLNCYLVKYKNELNVWQEIWAFNKTCIRNDYRTNGDIVKILEFEK